MIENEDSPTIPRPVSSTQAETTVPDKQAEVETTVPDNAATIQIPATAAPTTPEAAEPTTDATVAAPTSPEAPTEAPATTTAAPAPAHPAVTVEDLLALQIAGDPQISPDGALIAFSVQSCDGETNTTSSAIWLVPVNKTRAESARQVTTRQRLDFAPRWSPDGRSLAFLSDRSGTVQIHLLPMNGGEPRQLSQLKQGVSDYTWRPDGAALLAHSAWKPADDQEPSSTGDSVMIYTRLDEQWDGEGYRQGRHQQLWLLPLEGPQQRLTSEPVDLVQSCWSPDGTEVAFCANRRPQPDLSVSMALWVLTLASGQMRRLTPEEGLAQGPAWSPDGASIAYYFTADQTETGNMPPWVVKAQGNEAPRLTTPPTEDFTCQAAIIDELRLDWLGRLQWYPDGKSLLITVHERGQVHLHRVDVEQSQVTQLTSGNGRYLSPHLSRDGQTIAMVRADWFTPGDIWSSDGSGEQLRKLTGVNDPFMRSHQLVRPKRLTWQSSDGLEIEGWLYLPALADGALAPLILEVHGGPSCAWGDAYVHEFQVLAGRGYAVLAANPRGSQGYGEAFCRKILHDWGNDDLRDLLSGIDHVIATEAVDGSRLGIGGLSYGGYMTNWAVTQTTRFKAAVSRNGVSNLASVSLLSDQTLWFDLAMGGDTEQERDALRRERSALTFAERIATPLLLLHADNDLRCPFVESMQLFVALRKRKQMVELVRYPGPSHMLDWPGFSTPKQRVDRLRRTVGWFEHFV
ncbi:MAG: S9 family peptidase [Chloroflexota bacterium]|nr:S9 family peptidase [Chloroflexota bacterium]